MMLRLDFGKCIFITLATNLWYSDNPVFITPVLIKLRGLLVKIRSMQLGFSGFLKHVGLFTTDLIL